MLRWFLAPTFAVLLIVSARATRHYYSFGRNGQKQTWKLIVAAQKTSAYDFSIPGRIVKPRMSGTQMMSGTQIGF